MVNRGAGGFSAPTLLELQNASPGRVLVERRGAALLDVSLDSERFDPEREYRQSAAGRLEAIEAQSARIDRLFAQLEE